jgi:hypothetical protein
MPNTDPIGRGRSFVGTEGSNPAGRMSRARFKRDGTNAQTRFRLSEKRTSPFESVGVSI